MPFNQFFMGIKTEVYEWDHGDYTSLHIRVRIGIDDHTFELPCNMPHEEAKELGMELDRVITGASI